MKRILPALAILLLLFTGCEEVQQAAAWDGGVSTASKLRQPHTQETKAAQYGGSVSLDVDTYCQHPDYPTGCECAALYMLLRYYDADVTMAELVDALPKGAPPYEADGVLYAANPERAFVGDPADSSSYGVYNAPIAETANLFLPGAVSVTGAAAEDIPSILGTGNPVIAWYTTDPERGISYVRSWLDEETGEEIWWPSGEHAIVITGCDADSFTYNDPNTGGTQTVSTEQFSAVFDELGGRLVYYPDGA